MTWEKFWEVYGQLIVDYGTRIIGVLVLLLIAWIIAGWLSRLVNRTMAKAQVDETLTRFVGHLVRWLVILLAVLACLGVFGVQTTSFAAVIGAAGLAVGLAFQGTLSNFAAGVMLLVFRPFSVGDVVNAAGVLGKVHAIELFTVAIDTFDNRRIILPNSSVFGSTIENVSHHPIRRADVDVGTEYAADIDQTREVLMAAAKSVEGGLEDPAPDVFLAGLGASSVDWSVRVWCNSGDFGAVKQATIRAVKKALDDAGIGIPFPQMDVHLDSPASAPSDN
jgi:small conductance mechanosensitive channel